MKFKLVQPEEVVRAYYTEDLAADVALAREQVQYLEGVLWADPVHRLDKDPERDISAEMDRYGTGTKAMWRGVIENAGYICLTGNGDRKYPRFELAGSYRFLCKFIDFLLEEMPDAMLWADADKKLREQAPGGRLRITGVRAQDICRLLYVDQEVGWESIRRKVDEILVWTGKV